MIEMMYWIFLGLAFLLFFAAYAMDSGIPAMGGILILLFIGLNMTVSGIETKSYILNETVVGNSTITTEIPFYTPQQNTYTFWGGLAIAFMVVGMFWAVMHND